jgi:hypothetical protein
MGWPPPFPGVVGIALAALISVALFLFAARSGQKTVVPEALGPENLGPENLGLQNLDLQFSLAIVVAVLIAWQTNAHDLCLLILPLILVADYCARLILQAPAKFATLLPVLPVLISPLWMVLWLVTAKVNLMAIPLLWWAWRIGKDLSRRRVDLGVSDFATPLGIPK